MRNRATYFQYFLWRMTQNSPSSFTIPFSIWALGSVSFLMKISAVIVFNLSPLFITHVLGASMFTVGVLEGFIEAISLLTRIFAGVLSDFIHKRKGIIAIGYLFALASRPLLALATTMMDVFLARGFDRIGNGLDATPRDALVGDLAPPSIKGACYGLRESLSRAGAFFGSLLVMGLLWLMPGNYSFILWLAAIPTVLALLVLLIFVKDPVSEKSQHQKTKRKFNFKEVWHLPIAFWLTILLSALFMISNFSGAFLILRAEQAGLELHLISLVMIIQNLATAAVAYPVGYLSDKMGRRSMMALGIVLVILADILLATDGSLFMLLCGVLFWGAEMGITQSILAIFLADACPKEVRGTGFGLFHLVNGMCVIIANSLAGWMWSEVEPSYTFYTSAVLAAFSALVLPFIHKKAS